MIEVLNIRIQKVFREKKGAPTLPMALAILESKADLDKLRELLIKTYASKIQTVFGEEEIVIDISFKEK